jgi:hypothetical protein
MRSAGVEEIDKRGFGALAKYKLASYKTAPKSDLSLLTSNDLTLYNFVLSNNAGI